MSVSSGGCLPWAGLFVRYDLAQPLTARSLAAARAAAMILAERREPPAAGSLLSALPSAWRGGLPSPSPLTPRSVAVAPVVGHSQVEAVCRTVKSTSTQRDRGTTEARRVV